LITGKDVLDFGCGTGAKDKKLLAYRPCMITGIDLSARAIPIAKELEARNLKFMNKDIKAIKGEEKYDSIISYTAFEHISRPDMLTVLRAMYRLLRKNGNIVIVYNHYNDRFGSHLKEHIYCPWPQMIFDENYLFEFWNVKHARDKSCTEEAYFARDYKHGVGTHNAGCFMNLNKFTVKEFEAVVATSGLRIEKEIFYSRSFLCRIPLLKNNPYLKGSVIYLLKKSTDERCSTFH
jgi:cyclopropane fatty-acyl-phospholipid synthase-like methyltransferase